MAVFESRVHPSSDSFKKNRADMLALVQRLTALNGRAKAKSERRKARFDERGQLTPRARLAHLLDPGRPWLAIGNLAGYLADNRGEADSLPGSTVICGIGFISGVRCMVVVDDSGIMAGAMTAAAGAKMLRAEAIALAHKLPYVHLVESAGGDLLNYTVEGFISGGGLFAGQAKLSKAGVPVISVLHGSSTAGGAYMPGMSDYVVAVRGRGKAFLAGPPLLKAATGEIATEDELGGAHMHATVSGLAEYLADDDHHAVALARSIVDRLGWSRSGHAPRGPSTPPKYDPEEIAGVVPVDYRTPYDVREVMARVVDASDLLDFKPGYGASTVCVQAQVMGRPCALIGNNGPIDPDGATKTAQFLQLMDQADTPVAFLQNTTGYMVGVAYERAGMIKHGSKMIQAVTNIEVPKLTFMVGASYGAGNYGMCGRAFDPDFVYAWPTASTGVMGGQQAADVMTLVAEGTARAAGQEPDREALAQRAAFLTQMFDQQAGAFYTSGRNLDDGMIDPRDTRKTLGFLLATVQEGRRRAVRPNRFGVARM